MTFALWIVGLAAAYSMWVGIAYSLLWNITEFDRADSFVAAVFWPLSVPTLLGWVATNAIGDAIVARRERKRLPKAEVWK